MDFDPGNPVYELTPNGQRDIFILKLDGSGNFSWADNFGGWYEAYGSKVAIDGSGNILVAGSFKGEIDFDPGPDTLTLISTGVFDVFLLKLNPDGNLIWAKSYGGQSNDYVNDLKFDKDDNMIIGGNFRFSADFDPDPDLEYIVEGGVWGDIYLLKLDLDGNFKWVKTMGNEAFTNISSINIDSLNNIYFSVNFDQTLDIHPGDSSIIISPEGEGDFFIEKLNPAGEYKYHVVMGTIYDEYIKSVLVGPSPYIYTVGIFEGTPEYELNNSVAGISSMGQVDIFIQSIDQTMVNVPDYIIEKFIIYPNPSKEIFYITDLNPLDKENILICGNLGQHLKFDMKNVNKGVKITLKEKYSGILFVPIESGEDYFTLKHVVL